MNIDNQFYHYKSEDGSLVNQLRVSKTINDQVVFAFRKNNGFETATLVHNRDIPRMIEQLTDILKENGG